LGLSFVVVLVFVNENHLPLLTYLIYLLKCDTVIEDQSTSGRDDTEQTSLNINHYCTKPRDKNKVVPSSYYLLV